MTIDELKQYNMKDLRMILSALTEREQKVISLRLGALDGVQKSYDEIAVILNIKNVKRVMQIERLALRKMRPPHHECY